MASAWLESVEPESGGAGERRAGPMTRECTTGECRVGEKQRNTRERWSMGTVTESGSMGESTNEPAGELTGRGHICVLGKSRSK